MLTSNGGVRKSEIHVKGAEDRKPKDGDCVTCKYVGMLKSSGKKFDEGNLTFTVGENEVVKGFEIGVKSMNLNEKSTFHIRFDYGYGARGVNSKIPPHADLIFQIELLRFGKASDKKKTTLAIEDVDTVEARKRMMHKEEQKKKTTVISVDGEPVKIDHLGPIVLNSNGTMSRITNWNTMTKDEQLKTIRLIGKRNKIRRRKLRSNAHE